MDYSNKLIFGKNPMERIVSLEIDSDRALIFRELEDGELDVVEVKNDYWLLSSYASRDAKWMKLAGNQHYKYGKKFSSREELEDFRKTRRKMDLYQIWNEREAFMIKHGFTFFKGMKPNQVTLLSFDLETTGLFHKPDSFIVTISTAYRKNGVVTKKLFSWNDFANQGELITAFCDYVREKDPSILLSFNGVIYDLPYLYHCATLHGVDVCLGRDNSSLGFLPKESKLRVDGSRDLHYHKVKIWGREVVDVYFLALKYDQVEKKYESYGLKKIIEQEGLTDPNRTFYDAAKIRENYKIPEEMVKIKAYCEDDAMDTIKLFDLMVPAYFYTAQSVPKPFQIIMESATGSWLNALLVRSYIQEGHSIPKATKLDERPKGGTSFAIPGIYKNVIKVDLKSAYPSQVLRFKMYDKDKDPNANFYKMVEHFTLERFANKDKYKETGDKYYKDLESTGKVFINSAYGMTITEGLNFNCLEMGSKITAETRVLIDMSLKWSTGEGTNFWMSKFESICGKGETGEENNM